MNEIDFETASSYTWRCKPFKGERMKDIPLKKLDGFLGWAEDKDLHPVTSEAMRHTKRYLKEEHINARLEVEING